MKVKILLSLFSILFSFLIIEIGLRSTHYYLNKSQLFSSFHDMVKSDHQKNVDKNNQYKQDNTIEVFLSNDQKQIEILAIGDSFTNGGNISYDKTYPFKLFKKLNEKISVRNLGVCESSSFDVLKRLKKFYKSDEYSADKKYILVVLTGATDIFFNNIDPSAVDASEIHLKQETRKFTKDLTTKDESFLYNFKSLKLFSFLFNKTISKFKKTSIEKKAVELVGRFSTLGNPIFTKCLDKKGSEKVECVVGFIRTDSSINDEVRNELAEFFAVYFLTYEAGLDSAVYTQHIKDSILYYSLMGDTLASEDFFDLISNVSFLSLLQSDLTLLKVHGMLKTLLEKYKSKLNYIEFEQQLENFKYWSANTDEKRKKRKENLNEMISISNKNSVPIILMTYPLQYTQVNEDIISVANENKISLINLEKIFKIEKLKKPGIKLIKDGEHCSEEGYDIIAREVKAEVLKLKDNE